MPHKWLQVTFTLCFQYFASVKSKIDTELTWSVCFQHVVQQNFSDSTLVCFGLAKDNAANVAAKITTRINSQPPSNFAPKTPLKLNDC